MISTSWKVRFEYTVVALEDKYLNNKTSPSPCSLLAFTVSLVTAYPLGLFGSAVLARSPPKLLLTSSPVAFGGWLKRQLWCCTCTAEHQLRHCCALNTLPELHSTISAAMERQTTPVQQLKAFKGEDNPGITWQWEQRPKICTQCLTDTSLWFHPA